MKRTASEAFGSSEMDFDPAAFRRSRFRAPRQSLKARKPVVKTGKAHEAYQDRQIATLLREIRGRRPEMKYTELAVNNSSYANTLGTGSFICWPAIAQGTADFNSRIGDRITAWRLQSRWTLAVAPAVGVVKVRIIYFVYKENPDVVTPSPATVCNFYMNSTYDATPNIVNGTRDYDNRRDFTTLYDQSFVITQQFAAQTPLKSVVVNLDLKKMKVQFSAATASIISNSLYCIIVSDSSTSSGYSMVQRTWYTDS